MATKEVVSGVGGNSKRTDNNVSARVSKIQNEAKMQNAVGGPYESRADLTSIAGGASTEVPRASVSMPSPVSQITPVDAFAPGSGAQGIPLSDGAPTGPGRGSETQPLPVSASNPDSIFVRAMAAANPDSRQLMMMVEAYNEMEAE